MLTHSQVPVTISTISSGLTLLIPILKEWKLPTGLLSCVPKLVNDCLRHSSAANGCCLSISRDGDGVELSHVNLNSLGHFAQRGEGSRAPVEAKKGKSRWLANWT